MKKIDLKKELKQLYGVSEKEPVSVDVPPMNYLMIEGAGDPNTSKEYAEAVEALFAVSYAAKFAVKRGELAIDYGVMPLEGLWWADDMSTFTPDDKSKWRWTMMIMQPAFVTRELVQTALAEVKRKKDPPGLPRLAFETLVEGRAAQILHIGPFSTERPTIERLHAFVFAHGRLSGKHHEIYLGDIRRADPAKWKTIIRQPLVHQSDDSHDHGSGGSTRR